jgi:phosphoribosyl-dephospho-CoA transferase
LKYLDMPPLRRHQLAHLTSAGWREMLDHHRDIESRACIEHWANADLPVVVTRQPGPRRHPDDAVALGLAAPARWGRRALPLRVKPQQIAWFSEFPSLSKALGVLPAGERPAPQRLSTLLVQHGVRSHVYGSAGWQQVTGLAYLHERSDIDLWLAVDGPGQADAAVLLLQQCQGGVRLDGELMFPDGSAVAWREWAAWREGRCAQVLVKCLQGAALHAHPGSQLMARPEAA